MPISIQIIDKNYEISSKFEKTLEKIDLKIIFQLVVLVKIIYFIK